MDVQLLIKEESVKGIAVLDLNIAPNYLYPAIMEAQEVGLRGIIGTNLLEALKTKASEGTLADEYATLVNEYIVFYLAYQTKAELLPKVAYKAGNAGVTKYDKKEEGVVAASGSEVEGEIARAQAKADYHAYRMQLWLRDNAAALPELTQRDCDKINACLRSAASCGIWLGGARGSEYGEGCGCEDRYSY